MNLKPGWLAKQFYQNDIDIACWPDYMRREAGFDDKKLSSKQRREVISILKRRIKELE